MRLNDVQLGSRKTWSNWYCTTAFAVVADTHIQGAHSDDRTMAIIYHNHDNTAYGCDSKQVHCIDQAEFDTDCSIAVVGSNIDHTSRECKSLQLFSYLFAVLGNSIADVSSPFGATSSLWVWRETFFTMTEWLTFNLQHFIFLSTLETRFSQPALIKVNKSSILVPLVDSGHRNHQCNTFHSPNDHRQKLSTRMSSALCCRGSCYRGHSTHIMYKKSYATPWPYLGRGLNLHDHVIRCVNSNQSMDNNLDK